MKRVCSKPNCPHLQPCPVHTLEEQARRNERVKAYGYSSSNWQNVKKKRRAMAAGKCELDLPGCTVIATHTHLDPRLNGDHRHATVYNARACCSSCSGAVDAPRAKRTTVAA